MKRLRDDLEKTLFLLLEKGFENKRDVKQYVVDKLKEHNMASGTVKGMLGCNKTLIMNAKHAELYLFTKALWQATEIQSINIYDWYYEEEQKTYEQYQAETYVKDDKIVFNGVMQTSDYEFIIGKVTYQQMADISNQGLLFYNERTQRESNLTQFGENFLQVPGSNHKKIDDIAEMMKTVFEANLITLNIRKIGTEKFSYNPSTMTLIIEVDNEKTYLDIIDGFHRWQGAVRAIKENPNNEGYFHIKIFNMSEENAQAYLAREEKATPMDITHAKGLDKKDIYIAFVEDINRYGTSKSNEMLGKIAVNYAELKSQDKWVTAETLALAIKHHFDLTKLETVMDVEDLRDYLIMIFNRIISILKKKYDKNNSIIFDNNTFIGYTTIARMLKNDENWKEKLEKILDNIDFSINSKWKSLGIFSNKVDKVVKRISEHFEEVGGINV